VGANFRLRVKKNPLVCPTANAQVKKAWPSSHKAMVPVSGWGRGSGVFLGLCEKVFSITAMPGGRSYPLQVKFFLSTSPQWSAELTTNGSLVSF